MLSFSSYGWLTVIAFLDSSEDNNLPIVGCPDSYRFDPYCSTALGVRKHLVKKPISIVSKSTPQA